MTKNLRLVKCGIRSTKRNALQPFGYHGRRGDRHESGLKGHGHSQGDVDRRYFLSFLIWVEALAVQKKNQPVCSASAPVLIILCSPWRRYWLVVLSFMLVKKKKWPVLLTTFHLFICTCYFGSLFPANPWFLTRQSVRKGFIISVMSFQLKL